MQIQNHPNYLTHIHIADIHFGCIDPIRELQILKEQFIDQINRITFDILSIDGDLFDRKFAVNNIAVSCAMEFVSLCIATCSTRNAALIIIEGTESHDASQINIFRNMYIPTGIELYIVDRTQFIETHGVKILCIPEEYGKGSLYYDRFLKESYDMVFMHGTLINSIPGATAENLDSRREPVFSIESFSSCLGPIYAGHVHVAQCIQDHMYYISSPIRWKFGEEQPKGYMIALLDRNTYMYYNQFMPISSFIYKTISIDSLNTSDPNEIITLLDEMHRNGDNFIRLNCKGIPMTTQAIIKKYYHEMKNPYVKLFNKVSAESTDLVDINAQQIEMDSDDKLSFLLDDKLDELTKFVMYVNYTNGEDIISLDTLKKILSGG